jgi:hypothetical protein
LKHFLLIILAVSYFAYNILSLDSISNDGVIQSRAVLENFVSSSTVDKINSISENKILKGYYNKLYLEADFKEKKGLTTNKEGFKKPFLFFLFLKDISFTIFKVLALMVMCFFAVRLSISILRDRKTKPKSSLQ